MLSVQNHETTLATPTSPSGSQHPPRIIVEPTNESQAIYNSIRQEADRLNLQTYVTRRNNLLPPPGAPPMSRSTTSESRDDRSPVPSHADHTEAPWHSEPAVATKADGKRPRGKRKGPLDLKTRTNTALKRKLRLTCPRHRAKKTSCDCHDFSRLEDGYQSFLTGKAQPTRNRSLSTASQNSAVSPTSVEQRSFGELGTFGTGGGAATTPLNQEMDLVDLASPALRPPEVRASVRAVENFDLNSIDSVNAMTQQRTTEPYLPGTTAGSSSTQMYDQLIAIGKNTRWGNRWECEFKYATARPSDNSTDVCSWTGPFEQLSDHFKTTHCDFEEAMVPYWSICNLCSMTSSDWSGTACKSSGCRATSYQKWYYGSVKTSEIQRGPLSIMTPSRKSESVYSHAISPWTQPWSSATDPQSGWPLGSSPGNGSYEHSHDGKTSSDGAQAQLTVNYTWANGLSPFRWHNVTMSSEKRSYYSPLSESVEFECSACPLLPGLTLPQRHSCYSLLSLLPLLFVMVVIDSDCLWIFQEWALAFSRTIGVMMFWGLVLTLVGFVATWFFKDRLRIGLETEANIVLNGDVEALRDQQCREIPYIVQPADVAL
ncbi:hypothetical protein F5Y15DRAFT_82278 [Xylariaceae sp. FL0016]|nr:hypothetical protein F5Y15DRAFT_82278 [Xylariaceae sp. FL0016]